MVNRQLGAVNYIGQNTFNNVIKTYIKLHDNNAGLKRMNTENFVNQNFGVPLKRPYVYINHLTTNLPTT